MKLGIIGTGKIVADLMETYDLLPIEKTYILSTPRSVEKAQKIADEHHFAGVYTSYEDLLQSDIDTVYIALPNHLHYDYALQAINAHKHVICEKPFVVNSLQFDTLVQAAKEAHVFLLEAMTIHAMPAYQALKKDLSSLGSIKIVSLNYSQYSSRYDAFKEGTILPAFDVHKAGGALYDLNVYNIHFMIGLFGAPQKVNYLANIAHGCNSVRATRAALKLADYTITEAGFGADLGAEKFLDIKCRLAGLKPSAVVLVASIQALKYNGGVPKAELHQENLPALEQGIVNLEKHIENLHKFGVPVVVTLNSFVSDTDAESRFVEQFCQDHGCAFAKAEVWAKGGRGGLDLAEKVLETMAETPSAYHPIYDTAAPLKDKIETIAKEIYGADGVEYTAAATKALKTLENHGFGGLPVCIAKTQYSLSDDQHKLGRPAGFHITVRDAYVSAGAGFVVVLTGEIIQMPGLPKTPAALKIDVKDDGVITGLF